MATIQGKPLMSLRVVDLMDELEKRGLSKSGAKGALVQRLEEYILEHEVEDRDDAPEDQIVAESSEKLPKILICQKCCKIFQETVQYQHHECKPYRERFLTVIANTTEIQLARGIWKSWETQNPLYQCLEFDEAWYFLPEETKENWLKVTRKLKNGDYNKKKIPKIDNLTDPNTQTAVVAASSSVASSTATETPPLPSRNIGPPQSRPPVISPSRQNSR